MWKLYWLTLGVPLGLFQEILDPFHEYLQEVLEVILFIYVKKYPNMTEWGQSTPEPLT